LRIGTSATVRQKNNGKKEVERAPGGKRKLEETPGGKKKVFRTGFIIGNETSGKTLEKEVGGRRRETGENKEHIRASKKETHSLSGDVGNPNLERPGAYIGGFVWRRKRHRKVSKDCGKKFIHRGVRFGPRKLQILQEYDGREKPCVVNEMRGCI